MTPETDALCKRLEAWAPLVGSGYEVPAAAETILEAAAKLREMAGALEDVQNAMLKGGDGEIGDFGWSITKLNKARPLVRAALAGGSHG